MSEAREETKGAATSETARETGGAVIFGRRWSDEAIGFASALISAPCYSVSLFFMRSLTEYADVSADWSLVIKEMTTVVCIAPFILIQYLRGRYRFPTATVVALLLGAGFMCQFSALDRISGRTRRSGWRSRRLWCKRCN